MKLHHCEKCENIKTFKINKIFSMINRKNCANRIIIFRNSLIPKISLKSTILRCR